MNDIDDKNLKKVVNDIHGVLFGTPQNKCGLITEVYKLKLAVKNNTKISWAILTAIVVTAITIIFKIN